ncbi:MAG TPA: cytochrome b/b6 domain-containing protein, partial [Candidatus Krumholzibacteria bacterium]|nr:cytochrome b/b6 domain-containing protein [Candidatus Krumholzibacteria bacterium]
TRRGREQLREMLPRRLDLDHAITNLRYHLHRAPEPPAFGRFRYIEKAEYWALVWGTGIMVATGLILWFPARLDGPSWLVKVSEAVHFYEAWLAVLAILVWHLFFVLLRPGLEGGFTAITGKMQVEDLAHEHQAEYARIYAHPSDKQAAPEPGASAAALDSPAPQRQGGKLPDA